MIEHSHHYDGSSPDEAGAPDAETRDPVCGMKVPIDGVVINGQSHVDESMDSGDPIPVQKQAGDQIIGAAINGTGGLVMRAENRIQPEKTSIDKAD